MGPSFVKKEDSHVTLKVQREKEYDMIFRIRRNVPIRKLMLAYCDRLGLDYETIRFTIDGCKVGKDQTADDLKLENDDTIDAFTDQSGGGGAAISACSAKSFT